MNLEGVWGWRAGGEFREKTKSSFIKSLLVHQLQDHEIFCLPGMYVRTFQPGNFTGRGSEGVNYGMPYGNYVSCCMLVLLVLLVEGGVSR